MSLPVRCWGRYRIGDEWKERGCKAVLIAGQWVYQRPGLPAQDGGTCPGCGKRIRAEQESALVAMEHAVQRRCAKGFGQGDADPFRA